LSESESIAPQWAFKWNGALATAEAWHLKGHMLKVNRVLHF